MPANSTYSFSSGQILTAVDLNAVFAQTVAFAADSSNANTGTLPVARLPYSMDQGVATANNVQFNDLVLTGNMTVSGTTTFVNTAVLDVKDKNVTIAKGSANASVANGAGITIDGASAQVYYNSTSNTWVVTHPIGIGNSSVNATAISVGANVYVNTSAFFVGNGSANAVISQGTIALSNTLSVNQKVQVGNAAGYDFGTNALIEIDGNQDGYVQSVIQNAYAGQNASGDLVITADSGNDSVNFVDFGINSSIYSNSNYTITGALDAYLYSSNSNLAIGTASNKDVIFHANGTLAANRVLTVNAVGVTFANTRALYANASAGSNGQVLMSNGSAIYWSDTANNAAYLGGTIASSYLQLGTTGTLTGNLNFTGANVYFGTGWYIGANVIATTSSISVGNSTINAAHTSSTLSVANASSSTIANTLGLYTTGTVNASLLTTTSVTVNTSAVAVGANVVANLSGFAVGNSTVFANATAGQLILSSNSTNTATINSTAFTGTANNASYLANVAAASYVQNTDTRTLSGNLYFTGTNNYFGSAAYVGANVSVTTSAFTVGNSTVYINTTSSAITFSGNSTNTSTINSTAYGGTANNATYLANVAATSYVNTSGNYTLTGNLIFNGANTYLSATSYLDIGANLTMNSTALWIGNNTLYSNTTAGQIRLSSNSTNVATVNSTFFTGTSNNSLYLGNTGYQFYVTNTGNFALGGNIEFVGANNYFDTGFYVAANVIANTSAIQINSGASVNTTVAAGSILINGSSVLSNTDSRTLSGNLYFTGANQYFGTAVYVGANVSVNTSSHFVGNTTQYSNVTAGVIAISSNSTNSATVNSTFFTGSSNNALYLANVAAASYVQNTDTRTLSGNLNFTGTNTYFTSGLFVGGNVSANTSTLLVGNTLTNTNITAGQITLSGQTVNSTVFTGLAYTANSAAYLGSTAAAYYVANTDSRTLSGNLNFTGVNNFFSSIVYVGSNTFVNTSVVFQGNSTVNTTMSAGSITLSGTVVNSSVYTGTAYTANNATYLGGNPASSFLSASSDATITGQWTFGDATHSANLYFLANSVIQANGRFGTVNQVLTSNGTVMYWADASGVGTNTLYGFTWTNSHTWGNSTATANITMSNGNIIVANGYGIYANAGFGSVGQALVSNGTSMYWGAPTPAATYVQNTDSRTLSGNLNFTGVNNYFTNIYVGANVIANVTALFVGNSTINSYFNQTGFVAANGTVTANISPLGMYVGANSYVNSTTHFLGNSSVNTNITAGQITLSGTVVNSSVFTGLSYTANNSSYLGGTAAANFVQNTDSRTLSGNINFTGANVNFSSLFVGANVVLTGGSLTLGNSTVNTYTTNTSYTVANGTVTTTANTLGVYVGSNTYMNATHMFTSTNSTMNTVITANSITLNGSAVITTATTLKVYNAAGTQVFP